MREAKPGAAEQRLEPFAGTYALTLMLWSDPSAEPVTSRGSSVQRMVLGGWVLEVREEVPHLDLEFIGYHFYDPLKGKYLNVGMSNKTGWLGGWYGQFDEAGTVLTY